MIENRLIFLDFFVGNLLSSSNNRFKGREKISQIEFPKNFTIIGNLALAFWIALDTIAFLLISIVAGIVFLLVALIAIYGILKFLGCIRPCYNCKKCTFGLGRLAALYFGKRSLKDYKYNYKLSTALFFYAFIGPFPVAILLTYTLQEFTILKVAVLLVLVIFSVYSALTWRSNGKIDVFKLAN